MISTGVIPSGLEFFLENFPVNLLKQEAWVISFDMTNVWQDIEHQMIKIRLME